VRNINIIDIETAESFKVLFDSWNCRTNVGILCSRTEIESIVRDDHALQHLAMSI
jgi:hypothetical protein